MRVRLTLWACGRCGKPRGLHHFCRGGRKGRDRIKPRVRFICPSCHEDVPNLLTHTCSQRSDFRRRKAAQKRGDLAEARKRKRRATAARRRARIKERKRQAAERRKQQRAQAAEARRKRARAQTHDRERHDHTACTDEYCGKYACRIYRDGIERGRPEGHAEGYAEGYADGMTAAYQDK